MSENRTDPPKRPPPKKTDPVPAGSNGESQKPPTQNGVGQPRKDWDFLRDPPLDKGEEDGNSKNKE